MLILPCEMHLNFFLKEIFYVIFFAQYCVYFLNSEWKIYLWINGTCKMYIRFRKRWFIFSWSNIFRFECTFDNDPHGAETTNFRHVGKKCIFPFQSLLYMHGCFISNTEIIYIFHLYIPYSSVFRRKCRKKTGGNQKSVNNDKILLFASNF